MADPKIKIRRSATPNKVPTKDQLQLGELAINTYDGKLYLEQDQGGVGVGNTVIAVNPWSVGVGSTGYNTQFTAGKVGVGTTNAQYNLDVGGDINFTGNLYQDGSAFTSGVGIRTAGGTVGWAATIIDFRGPGVTTAYYSSSSGIGTVYFQGGGGGGNASVTVADAAPSSPGSGDLWFKSDVGELYVYYADGSSNQWVAASGGSNTVVTSDSAPSTPNDGDLWWNSDTGELKVYYNDGNSSQWVDASSGGFVQYFRQTNTNGTIGVTTTSFVGIGTTTATDALTVVGAADIDGNLIVSGVSTFSDNINLPDNKKIQLGAANDLDIYHTASGTSWIRHGNTSEYFVIEGNQIDFRDYSNSHYRVRMGPAVELRHNNIERLKTSSTGVTITGDLAASGNVTGVAATFTGNVTVGGVLTYEDVKNVDAIGVITARSGIIAQGDVQFTGQNYNAFWDKSVNALQFSDNAKATWGDHAAAGDLQIHHSGTHSYIQDEGTGNLYIDANQLYLRQASDDTVLLQTTSAGAVQVKHNGNLKFETTNTGVSITGDIVGSGSTAYSTGLIVGKQGAEFQGVVTASSFKGSGADLTDVISGVGIDTGGTVVGYAATIIHFRGPGVSTAYYSDTTGIGTVYFEGGGGGNATVTIQDTAPSSPSAGDMWWESDTGELKIYYNDGNSSQWVDANGSDDNVFVSTTAPSSPIAGDLWFNSESGDLFVYYTDANTSQWVSVNASASRQYWSSNSTGISTTQYVGIGTTTATDALTVVGATDLDGRLLVSGFTTFTGRVTLDNGSNAGRDIQWQPSSDRLSWFDNTKATFGDGADLQIFHNTSDSVISQSASGTGNLKILSGGAQSIECVQAGAVKIAHNGNDKIETTSGGAKVTGDLQVTGVLTYEDVKNVDSVGIITARAGIHAKDDVTFYGATSGRDLLWDKSLNILNFKDNTAAKFGNDYDLSIYHNNSIGIIANSTGALTLLSDTIVLNNEANSAAQIQAVSGASGYVKLFQDGDEKLATSSTGATVTGDITISDSIIHTGDTDTKIRFADNTIALETAGQMNVQVGETLTTLKSKSGTDTKLRFQHQGNSGYGDITVDRQVNAFIIDNDPSNAGNNATYFSVKNKGTENLRITHDGKIGIGIQAPTKLLDIAAATSADGIRIKSTGNTYNELSFDANRTSATNHIGRIISNWNGTAVSYISMDTGSDTTNKDDGMIRFWTANGSGNFERLRITSAGQVQINRDGGSAALTLGASQDFKLYHDAGGPTIFSDTGNQGFKLQIKELNLTEYTGGTTRLKLDSSGRVLIGTTTEGNATADDLTVATSGNTGMTIRSGTSNEGNIFFSDGTSGDAEYRGMLRYEHNNDAMVIKTAANERLRIGSDGLHTITCLSYSALNIKSNNNDNNGPEIQLIHNTGSPAANDCIAQIRFKTNDSAGNTDLMSRIETILDSPTSGAESAHLNFATRGLGSFNTILRLNARSTASAPSYTTDDMNGIILDTYNTGNPYPRYFNFIAKSAGNTDSNISFWTEAVDGSPTEKLRITSAGNVGIGTDDPKALLHVGVGGTFLIGENTAPYVTYPLGTGKVCINHGNSAGNYFDLGGTQRSANGLNKIFTFHHGYWGGSKEVASMGVVTLSNTGGSGWGEGDLVFYTGTSGNGDNGSTSTERVRIDHEGKVGIGIDSLTSQLEIKRANVSGTYPNGNAKPTGASIWNDGGDIFTGRLFLQGYQMAASSDFLTGINNEGNSLVMYNYGSSKYMQKWQKSGANELYWSGSSGVGKKLETTSDGIQITGHLKFDDGYGIDFSAETNEGSSSQNTTLADYEEGTWTPTNSIGMTLTVNNTAHYVKVGKLVTVWFDVSLTGNPDTAQCSVIQSLPYLSYDGNNFYGQSNSVWYSNNNDAKRDHDDDNTLIFVNNNSTTISLWNVTGGHNHVRAWAASSSSVGRRFRGTVTYRAKN